MRLLLRGTILNRTYGTHKNLYTYLFLPTISGTIYYAPRNIMERSQEGLSLHKSRYFPLLHVCAPLCFGKNRLGKSIPGA